MQKCHHNPVVKVHVNGLSVTEQLCPRPQTSLTVGFISDDRVTALSATVCPPPSPQALHHIDTWMDRLSAHKPADVLHTCARTQSRNNTQHAKLQAYYH